MNIDHDLNWGSHLPILMKVMSVSTGDVLEMGAGLYSSPFLYWMCKDQRREFISVEQNFEWWKMIWNVKNIKHLSILSKVVGPKAQANYVNDWDLALEQVSTKFWDVVLIDHAPSRRRIVDIKELANKTNYMVIHDTQRNYKFCNYNEIFPLFKYRFDYSQPDWDSKVPHTTVLSNFKDLSCLKN